jgi:ASC-1-like (ASCH) protein
MHHVAIMNKSWKLIPKILSGEKTIESRWYHTKRSPWNIVSQEDTVFFKDSGSNITASAKVARVIQYEHYS